MWTGGLDLVAAAERCCVFPCEVSSEFECMDAILEPINETVITRAQFHRAASTNMYLAWNFCLDKTGIPTENSTWFSGWANYSWIPVKSNMHQEEICLVILFLSRKKFLAKQISVLSSSMELGQGYQPGEIGFGWGSLGTILPLLRLTGVGSVGHGAVPCCKDPRRMMLTSGYLGFCRRQSQVASYSAGLCFKLIKKNIARM